MRTHLYDVTVAWTAHDSVGTETYRSYSRNHTIEVAQKPVIAASSDVTFRGDRGRYNPEELFVAALSSCHMLWYLHLCSSNGIVIKEYRDRAVGKMETDATGAGEFVRVELHPEVAIGRASDPARALALHEEAHRFCFIARSVKFPVEVCAQLGSVRLEDARDE